MVVQRQGLEGPACDVPRLGNPCVSEAAGRKHEAQASHLQLMKLTSILTSGGLRRCRIATHLSCSVCGAKNSDTYHPIWVRADARAPGGDRPFSGGDPLLCHAWDG